MTVEREGRCYRVTSVNKRLTSIYLGPRCFRLRYSGLPRPLVCPVYRGVTPLVTAPRRANDIVERRRTISYGLWLRKLRLSPRDRHASSGALLNMPSAWPDERKPAYRQNVSLRPPCVPRCHRGVQPLYTPALSY